jgi:hypothetical protein
VRGHHLAPGGKVPVEIAVGNRGEGGTESTDDERSGEPRASESFCEPIFRRHVLA